MENWGETVIVKDNAPELLLKEARRGMNVWLSSMSDAYQPVEAQEKLTKRAIEVLGKKGVNVDILTKNTLILRDLDVLKRYNVTVGFTIVSTKKIDVEKNAPHPRMRIEALKDLKEAGLRTYVFIGPLLPETDVEDIVRKTKDYTEPLLL